MVTPGGKPPGLVISILSLYWPYEHRACQAVFAVAHGVEDGFPNGPFVEGRDIPDEEAILKVLLCVAKINSFPELVEEREESLPELDALVRRTRNLVRAVLEDDFGVREEAAEGAMFPKEDQSSVG